MGELYTVMEEVALDGPEGTLSNPVAVPPWCCCQVGAHAYSGKRNHKSHRLVSQGVRYRGCGSKFRKNYRRKCGTWTTP